VLVVTTGVTTARSTWHVRKGSATSSNAVGHLVDDHQITVDRDRVEIDGRLAWAKHARMSTGRLLVLRAIMLGPGRLFPDLVRRLLQRLLIIGRRPAPFRFRRAFEWTGPGLRVMDELRAASWTSVEQLGLGGHQTSIYVVMSRVFAREQLQPWQDLTAQLATLPAGQPFRLERRL
jgi:hypothetical protein